LRAQLANALARLHLTALLLLKGLHGLRLRLAVALRQKVGNRAGLLIEQVALHLSALNAFALAAKGTRAHSTRRCPLGRDHGLAVHLLHGRVNHLLAIRVHEVLSRSWIKPLRGTAKLANALLDRGLGLAKTWLPCRCHGGLRSPHAGLLSAIKPRLRSGHSGLLRRIKRRADTLAKTRLLRGLLRHLDGLLPLANGLAKTWLLRGPFGHH
jgi:hypothetical protein